MDNTFLYSEVTDLPLDEVPGDGVHDWESTFPTLKVINDRKLDVLHEVRNASADGWFAWPQSNLWREGQQRWDVLPLLGFGMRALDKLACFPLLAELLTQVKGLRTAIFSRVGPRTKIKPHRGPFALSSNILRCHFGIQAPRNSGIWVNGQFVQQEAGEWIVFDDTKLHSGINDSDEDKIVLLLDLKRPEHAIPASWPRYPFPTGFPPGWESIANANENVERFDPESL